MSLCNSGMWQNFMATKTASASSEIVDWSVTEQSRALVRRKAEQELDNRFGQYGEIYCEVTENCLPSEILPYRILDGSSLWISLVVLNHHCIMLTLDFKVLFINMMKYFHFSATRNKNSCLVISCKLFLKWVFRKCTILQYASISWWNYVMTGKRIHITHNMNITIYLNKYLTNTYLYLVI